MRRDPTRPATADQPLEPRALISRSATVALWRVLNALREGWLLEKRLRHVARMIAEEARRQGLTSDQMLAALQLEWPRLLECRRVPDEADLRMLADQLMRCCVDEFAGARGAVTPHMLPVGHTT